MNIEQPTNKDQEFCNALTDAINRSGIPAQRIICITANVMGRLAYCVSEVDGIDQDGLFQMISANLQQGAAEMADGNFPLGHIN